MLYEVITFFRDGRLHLSLMADGGIYSWRPATLSLGWFQRLADVPQVEHAERVVRRRITSYNVCYTKLLRSSANSKSSIAFMITSL